MIRVPLSWCAIVLTLAGAAYWLLAVGRPALCPCGEVRLWVGNLSSAESSQQVADWLTPLHLLHGLLIYWALSLFKRVKFSWRLAFAILFAAVWEIAENSAFYFEHYVAVHLRPEQQGDSVINALSDILVVAIGFWLGARLPVKVSVALFVGVELLLLWMIHDGMMVRALMGLYPLEVVRDWQAAGWAATGR